MDYRRIGNVGIMSIGEFRNRLLAVARGEITLQPGEPKLWVESEAALKKILCDPSHVNFAAYSHAVKEIPG